MDLEALAARYHRAFNDRDFEVWREVLDEDVELLIDGTPFRGVAAAVAYGVGSVSQFPGLYIASERVVAESEDTVVTEVDLMSGDPAGGHSRPVGTSCEICRVRDGRIVSIHSYYMPEPAGRPDAVRVPVRGEAGLVAEEQAALRRVATLAARGVSQDELFAAVTRETGWLVNADTTSLLRFETDDTVTLVAAWSARPADLPIGASRAIDEVLRSMRETGRPWRSGPADLPPTGTFVDEARALGMRSFVGAPITVDGRVWGVAFASAADQPFAEDAEARLAGFTDLVGTAIANAHARVELRGFADEQAALRRVATLVATGAAPAEVFAAVAGEVGALLEVDYTVLVRSDPHDMITVAGTWTGTGTAAPSPVGSRFELGGRNVSTRVLRTGRPARMDAYADVTGAIGNTGSRDWGFRSSVGAPISVEGRLWGLIIVAYTRDEPLPIDTEARLAGFTELVATAIANAQARVELRGFTEEQAALRRMATLVARAAAPEEVFAAVTAEIGALWSFDGTLMSRYEQDDAATAVGAWSSTGALPLPLGTRAQVGGRNVLTLVFQTRRPARIDNYTHATGPLADVADASGIRSSVGVPISVEGRLWGVMSVVSTREEPLPADTEARLAGFTELIATAIANTQAQHELRELADTQAALRRLATLVARGEPPEAVFAAATREALRYSGNGTARMIRFELDGTATLVANEGATVPDAEVGERWEDYPPDGLTATVRRTGRAARVDDYSAIEGGEATLREGIRSAVAVPIHVNGRLWGLIAVGPGPLPPDTEQRMSEFTDLVATAVANAQNRAELIASRARIVAASDEARRRIERDLHDGAQQHLVALALRLRSAAAPHESDEFGAQVKDAAADLLGVIDEVREISHGIHPAILSRAGLGPALRALGRRSPVPMEIDVRINGRLPEPVEVGAYYVVSEMLTNATKHAHASVVAVAAEASDGTLRLSVRDDGVGGADPRRGSGLVGLKDRIEALGGTLSLHSPAGAGTTMTCELPLSAGTDDDIQSRRGGE
jgi:GAF domain-containing protein/ketosteroid isomerase-like protein